MKTIISILFYILSFTVVYSQPKNLFTSEVKHLLQEINDARSNPKQYGINNHIENERLDTILKKEPLVLNYNLCKKAYQYSQYLSTIKYDVKAVACNHSNLWLNESITFSTSLNNTLYQFIYDDFSISKGHRFHLLSVDNKDTKIGIGISYSKQLNWYIIVIVTED